MKKLNHLSKYVVSTITGMFKIVYLELVGYWHFMYWSRLMYENVIQNYTYSILVLENNGFYNLGCYNSKRPFQRHIGLIWFLQQVFILILYWRWSQLVCIARLWRKKTLCSVIARLEAWVSRRRAAIWLSPVLRRRVAAVGARIIILIFCHYLQH